MSQLFIGQDFLYAGLRGYSERPCLGPIYKNVVNVRTGGGRNHASSKISRTASRLRGTEPARIRNPFANCGSQLLTDFFLGISFNIIILPTEGTPMLTSNYGPLIIGSEAERPREANRARASLVMGTVARPRGVASP